jgi:glycogen operon protein
MKTFITSPGFPMPHGPTLVDGGVNFALFSRHAEAVSLLFFSSKAAKPGAVIKLDPAINRTGDIWHILVHGLPPDIQYGYRVAGPSDPTGAGHRFDVDQVLLDPYARALTGGEAWGQLPDPGNGHGRGWLRRCLLPDPTYDWEGDRPLNIPLQDSVIYELHVRGFTIHDSAVVTHPGTYAGLVDKIPYLRKLGVTALELMPVAEFNENELLQHNPVTGERLRNLWGYSPLAFFAPKAGYASDSRNGNQVREFKEMVKALHRAGIEVILDVVYNHTAEGGGDGPVISFRGLDNTIYYMLDPPSRDYLNFSGCGNTLNCNHPVVRQLIVDCLRYWVTEMHVDGFRFDLASVMVRSTTGRVLVDPPMVEQIAEDPILSRTKIIAEAWDAGGLYQVGRFSMSPRWAEWNGHFRDDVRGFLCGREDTIHRLATRIAGSSDLYQRSTLSPLNSINFVTSHDGFTLHDLVSYNIKHNLANGEDNRDGDNHNISWNSGMEGYTVNPRILALRARRMRTFAVILFLSQGVPMLLAGDEFGRTQQGNNNAYCQDNETGWVDWTLAKKNKGLLRFFRLLIALRKEHAVFRRTTFFPATGGKGNGEINWQSVKRGKQDWSPECKTLAFLLDGRSMPGGAETDFFVMLNGHRQPQTFEIPKARQGGQWLRVVDTAAPSPGDIAPPGQGVPIVSAIVEVAAMGAVVLMMDRRTAGRLPTT